MSDMAMQPSNDGARRPVSPALTALIVAGAAIAASLVIGRGIGTLISESQPEVAISLGISSPDGLLRLAEKERNPEVDTSPQPAASGTKDAKSTSARNQDNADPVAPDLVGAWSTAARALAAQPLNARALRALGQVADQRGDPGAALQLMNAAVKRSIRDPLANIWLANFDLSQKDYPKALDRIDALLRTSPAMMDSALPVLVGIASTPEATDALVKVLVQNPPWRANFLSQLPSRVTQADGLDDLYLKLVGMRPAISNDELKPYLDTLIRQNFIEQAYYLWIKTLPADRLARLDFIYNGDFQSWSSGLPFDWVMDPIQGATASIATYPHDDQRRALDVEFGSGGRVPFQNVTQMTLMPPGRYRLSGEYRADDLVNRRGMTWRIYCAESGALVAETQRVSGSTDGWNPFDVTFDIPNQGCRAQWLRLELAYRVDIEQEVSGSIWYDNLHIESIAPGGPAQAADPSRMRIKMPTAASNFEQAIQKPK